MPPSRRRKNKMPSRGRTPAPEPPHPTLASHGGRPMSTLEQARRSGSFFYPETLVHLLRHRATHHPDDRAFTYLVDGEVEELHLTYAQLDTQARAIGAWLE